jgi:hypothetical protein
VSRIFGPERDEVTGGWRKLHNEELHKLYSSPSIIRIIKSKRMRCAGHVARIGEENQKKIDHWDIQDVGGRTILKWILDRMVWIGLMWLRVGTSGGLL